MTEKEFLRRTAFREKLVKAVIRQFGGWEAFISSAPDVVNHGIDGGFGGFIYYLDTVDFYNRNKKSILELVEYEAFSQGVDEFEMLKNFKCMEGITAMEIAEGLFSNKGDDLVKNCLSWFAAEEVCRAYTDLRGE